MPRKFFDCQSGAVTVTISHNLEDRLLHLNNSTSESWRLEQGCLHKKFQFKDFKDALRFMNEVGQYADSIDHHPDWCNAYNKVSVYLNTHSESSVTTRDFVLAEKMEEIMKARFSR